MFTESDYDNLQQLMAESPENRDLLTRLQDSHRMEISTISHEIRNPLTLVYSTLQLIESAHPEVHSFRHWSDLHSDVEYMVSLLEDLSTYNNGIHLSKSPTNLDTFLKTTAISFAASLIETEIEFTSRIQPNLPVLSIDSIKLKEVLLNLLRNAKDAVTCSDCSAAPAFGCSSACSTIQPNHPQIRLCAETDPAGHELIISVTDNGCGISEDHLDSIFQPFVTFKKNGTGLGLALSRRILEAHNGSIQVVSTPDLGTAFTLRLPIQ